MFFLARAATTVAAFVTGAVLIGTSAPGSAQELASNPITNALAVAQLPPADAMTVSQPLQTQLTPAIVTDDDGSVPQADLAAPQVDDFGTLSDAVAAQDVALDADSELRCLASGVYFESKGEPLAGQLAVAEVILNRTRSGRFPKSVCSVVSQPGQFSFVRGGSVPSGSGSQWKTAIAVAKVAQRDLWEGALPDGTLYFHARGVAPGWRMQKTATIGNHIFYRR